MTDWLNAHPFAGAAAALGFFLLYLILDSQGRYRGIDRARWYARKEALRQQGLREYDRKEALRHIEDHEERMP